MNYIFSLAVSLSILASCSSTKEVVDNTTEETTTVQTEEMVNPQGTEQKIIFEDLAKGDSLFASVKKGYCYGTCPVYVINI